MANNTDTCHDLVWNGGIPKADADISGKGVVLAFFLSAYFTFFVTLISYLCGLVDDDLLSSVDQKIFYIKHRATRYPTAHAALQKAVLVLSDQQVVTGIAIMGAGFQGLRKGDISSYHFQIVVYLAWMSSSVHLSALTLLSSFLNTHKGLLVSRLCGMLVLLVLLVVDLVPTISNDWGIEHWPAMVPGHTGWGIPAICFWGRLYGNGISPDAVVSLAILGWSYVWKVGALFFPHRRWYNRWIRFPVENVLIAILIRPARRYVATRDTRWLWLYRLGLVPSLTIFAIAEFFTSFAASMWLSLLGLIFGTVQVLIPRQQVARFTQEEEDSWEFGQLVPLILLILPLGAVLEHVWPRGAEHEAADIASPQITRDTENTAAAPENYPELLLDFLGGPISGKNLSASERQAFKSILLETKLFKALIWLLQAGILTTFVFVFYYDGFTIGYTRTHSWGLIIMIIVLSLGTGLLTALIIAPFSRLGRSKSRLMPALQSHVEQESLSRLRHFAVKV